MAPNSNPAAAFLDAAVRALGPDPRDALHAPEVTVRSDATIGFHGSPAESVGAEHRPAVADPRDVPLTRADLVGTLSALSGEFVKLCAYLSPQSEVHTLLLCLSTATRETADRLARNWYPSTREDTDDGNDRTR